MNFSLIARLAFRYLRGKGSANAVPILSRISMVAIGVSSAAMIILFSVFNGFEGLVDEMYKAFYPDVKISISKGKFFQPQPALLSNILSQEGIAAHALVCEDNVLVNTPEGETIPVTLKGVSNEYFTVTDVQAYISKGSDSLLLQPFPTAIVGQQIAAVLGIDVDNVFAQMTVYYPNAAAQAGDINPSNAFQSLMLKPDGSFFVQDEFDSKYILAPLPAVQALMKQGNALSSIELKLQNPADATAFATQLQQKLGPTYTVASRYQQNKAVYMVMQSEKWAGYAILLFVLLIASFNMVSALSLLVLEKQKDLGILRSMGLRTSHISLLILLEGALWALLGGGIGLALGLLLCWGQIQFAFIKIPGAFIIDAFPVSIHLSDVLVVLLTIATVGILAAIYPARRAAAQKLHELISGK